MTRLAAARPRRRVVASTAIALLTITYVSACTGKDVERMDESLTLDQAKAENLRWQDAIAGSYDDSRIVSVRKAPQGVLLSCSDDQYQWTGRVEVELSGERDERADLATFSDVFTDEDGFDVAVDDAEGHRMVVVSGEGGQAFVGSVESDADIVSVATASRCFTLREGESPLDRY